MSPHLCALVPLPIRFFPYLSFDACHLPSPFPPPPPPFPSSSSSSASSSNSFSSPLLLPLPLRFLLFFPSSSPFFPLLPLLPPPFPPHPPPSSQFLFRNNWHTSLYKFMVYSHGLVYFYCELITAEGSVNIYLLMWIQ